MLGLDLKSIKALLKRIEKNDGSAIPGLYGCHDNHKRLVQRAHAVYLHLKTLVVGSRVTSSYLKDVLYATFGIRTTDVTVRNELSSEGVSYKKCTFQDRRAFTPPKSN
eukprot:30667-Pelagococcus_subviridis.AAC.5